MFNISHNQDLNTIEINNSSVFFKVYLNQGASLQELTLGGQELIKDMKPLTYNTTYASSILFPFANRIKDGSYEFEGQSYQFDINEEKLNNALHGLIYNKTFEVLDQQSTETQASVKLAYHEQELSKGFPFTYIIYLEYILTATTLDIHVEVKNTDSKPFPFTLGWHPYFLSSDLRNSSIIFDSKEKLKLDQRNITEKIIANEHVDGFKIKDQFLDDCFILESKAISFKTPEYILNLKTSEEDCYLQLYTPPHKNTIAIEPTTGVSDSFNNGIGLKTLQPNETYKISWNLNIENN